MKKSCEMKTDFLKKILIIVDVLFLIFSLVLYAVFVAPNALSLRLVWHYNEADLLMIRKIAPLYLALIFYFTITFFSIYLVNKRIISNKNQAKLKCLIPNQFFYVLGFAIVIMILFSPVTKLLVDFIPKIFPYFNIQPILDGLDPPFTYFDQAIE